MGIKEGIEGGTLPPIGKECPSLHTLTLALVYIFSSNLSHLVRQIREIQLSRNERK